jgi:hypothetical protein
MVSRHAMSCQGRAVSNASIVKPILKTSTGCVSLFYWSYRRDKEVARRNGSCPEGGVSKVGDIGVGNVANEAEMCVRFC